MHPGLSSCRQQLSVRSIDCHTRSPRRSPNSSPPPCRPTRTGCPSRCGSSSQDGGWRAAAITVSRFAHSRTTGCSTSAASSTAHMSIAANDSPGTILIRHSDISAPDGCSCATPVFTWCPIREMVSSPGKHESCPIPARIRVNMRVGGPTLRSAGTARQQHPNDSSPAPSAPTGARTRRMNQSPARHSDPRPRSVLAGLA